MTNEQIRTALDVSLRCTKYGPTKRPRLAWNLIQAGLTLPQAYDWIDQCVKAKVLTNICAAWVMVTPMGYELVKAAPELLL